jgi:hypothetical protein
MVEEGHRKYEKHTYYVTEDIDWIVERGRRTALKSIILLIPERSIVGKLY